MALQEIKWIFYLDSSTCANLCVRGHVCMCVCVHVGVSKCRVCIFPNGCISDAMHLPY